MGRLLHCPYCLASFPFADWQRAATCPSCGRRLSFFEATGQAAPGGPAAGAPAAGGPATGAPSGGPAAATAVAADVPGGAGLDDDEAMLRAARLKAITQSPAGMLPAMVGMAQRAATMPLGAGTPAPKEEGRTFFGKPLRWSAGWTIVVVLWLVAASALVVARVEMGHLTALSGRERAALAAVEHGSLDPGVTYAHALDLLVAGADPLASLTGHPASRANATWYVIDRPWEKRVYVYWEYPGYQPLVWIVEGSQVKPDGETALALKAAVRDAQTKQQQQQQTGLPSTLPF